MLLEHVDLSKVSFLTFLAVFAAGVLTSFTPCVYPLIPVTAGFIGARTAGSRSYGFALSFFYVLGLALVYSALGMFAALTGRIFGEIHSHFLTLIVMGNIFIFLALAMLGVFNLQFSFRPEALQRPLSGRGRKDIAASFLLGAASAFAAGPCTAPVLGALLVWISKTREALLGGALMFVFSLGLGTLLLLIGSFAGLLGRLPRSGCRPPKTR